MAPWDAFIVKDEEDEQEAEPIQWGWMCKPRVPCMEPTAPPPFYRLHQKIPWMVAIVMGFQHSLAMIGGIVSVPLLLAGPFDAKMTQAEKEYLISAGLITSGILSMIQIKQFKFGDSGYMLGTGLISVLGTSFTFVPIARTAFGFYMADVGDDACVSDADCTNAWADGTGKAIPGVTNAGQCDTDLGFCKHSGQEAYGAFLGTAMICAFLEICLSFLPHRTLRRAFPPIVTGTCVLLIGIGLTGTGMKYWGGGAFCADNAYKRMHTFRGENMPGDVTATYPALPDRFVGALRGACSYTPPTYDAETNMTMGDVTTCERFKDMPGIFPAQSDVSTSTVKCGNNGQVVLPFGSPEYVGLGFAVFGTLLLVEVFGSPFLRNCEVALALLFGFFIAGVSHYTPPGSDEKFWFVTSDKIEDAPGITFLWVHTFPLSVYGPAFLPLLICYIITTVESVGDISASAEVSRVKTSGLTFDKRVQGGLTADGVCSFLACLFTSPPNTTFSQNSGVVALTRCANKRAGYMCACFLILFGIIAKISAIIASIPDCVLGGMTTFLFVNIAVSGLKILGAAVEGRRNRFIVAASLALGIGVAIVPHWANNNLISGGKTNTAKLARDSAIIILQTPYCIGTLACMILHAIVPEDKESPEESASESEADSVHPAGKLVDDAPEKPVADSSARALEANVAFDNQAATATAIPQNTAPMPPVMPAGYPMQPFPGAAVPGMMQMPPMGYPQGFDPNQAAMYGMPPAGSYLHGAA